MVRPVHLLWSAPLLALAACYSYPAKPPEPPAFPAAMLQPTAAPESAPVASASQPLTNQKRPAPSVMLERVEGADAARARAIFAPVRQNLQQCSPGSSGALRVRIHREDDQTKMNVEPGTSLDARGRRCVLESLSTVDTDGVLERGSPSDRPSGFSALVHIEW